MSSPPTAAGVTVPAGLVPSNDDTQLSNSVTVPFGLVATNEAAAPAALSVPHSVTSPTSELDNQPAQAAHSTAVITTTQNTHTHPPPLC